MLKRLMSIVVAGAVLACDSGTPSEDAESVGEGDPHRR